MEFTGRPCLFLLRCRKRVTNIKEGAKMGDFIPVNTKVQRAGDVTQLFSLIGRRPQELEPTLGYQSGRLRVGWSLLFLNDAVTRNGFRWDHMTAHSGGRDKSVVEFQAKNSIQM